MGSTDPTQIHHPITTFSSGEHECVGLSRVALHAAGLAPAAAGQLRYKTFFKRDFPPKEVLTSHQQLSFFLHLDQVLPWSLETARSVKTINSVFVYCLNMYVHEHVDE